MGTTILNVFLQWGNATVWSTVLERHDRTWPSGDPSWQVGEAKKGRIHRFRTAQWDNPERIAIAPQGGQQRPLFTPNTWSPESSEQEEEAAGFCGPEEIEANLEDVVDLTAPTELLPLSCANPETVLLKARPKGPDHPPPKWSSGSAPSSSSGISRNNPLLRPAAIPKPSSSVPKSGSATAPRTPPKAVVSSKSSAPVIDLEAPSSSTTTSVRTFRPISQERLRGVEAFSFGDCCFRETMLVPRFVGISFDRIFVT